MNPLTFPVFLLSALVFVTISQAGEPGCRGTLPNGCTIIEYPPGALEGRPVCSNKNGVGTADLKLSCTKGTPLRTMNVPCCCRPSTTDTDAGTGGSSGGNPSGAGNPSAGGTPSDSSPSGGGGNTGNPNPGGNPNSGGGSGGRGPSCVNRYPGCGIVLSGHSICPD